MSIEYSRFYDYNKYTYRYTRERRDTMIDRTPEELYKVLKETVIGQDSYLKSLATTFWLHDSRTKTLRKEKFYKQAKPQKQNMLIIGPTGSGKTLAIQTLAKLMNYDLLIANAPDFTGNGWKGRDAQEMIEDLYNQCDHDRERTECGIIFLDEIDKIIQGKRDKTEYPTFGVENPLLKIVEGYPVLLKNSEVVIDTSNILFITAGAFDGIEKIINNRVNGKKSIGFEKNVRSDEVGSDMILQIKKRDLMEYGLSVQFLSRFSRVSSLRELTAEDLKNILLRSRASVVKGLDTMLRSTMGIRVQITAAGAEAVVKQAMSEKTGARGVNFMIQEIMDDFLFLLPSTEHVKAISIFSKNGDPAIKFVEGDPEQKKSDQPVQIQVKNPAHVPKYVDYLLNSDVILACCSIREIRALHKLLTAIILYLLDICSDQDYTIDSIKKMLKIAIKESDRAKSTLDLLMNEFSPTDKIFTKLFEEFKEMNTRDRIIEYAILSCSTFEKNPIYMADRTHNKE